MKNHLALLLPLFISLACASVEEKQTPLPNNNSNPIMTPKPASGVLGSVERLDPAIDKLLAKDAQMEKLAEGFDWSEGPVWMKGGFLVFSDVPQNTVYKYKDGEGVTVFLKPSGYTGSTLRGGEPGSNGLTTDRAGNLVLCQHGDRAVSRLIADPRNWKFDPNLVARDAFDTLTEKFEGKRFNSPNDLCYDSKGNLFFTDPPYGLPKNVDDPAKEIPFQGVYRLSADGKLTLLTKELTRPNGIALSPDEKTLYVAVSDPKDPVVWAFDLKADGTIANARKFFDAKPLADKKLKGLPDGLKLDRDGNLWCTGPGGVIIISPQGKHLGSLLTDQATANCAWGDDGSTLYITADMFLCRIKTTTKGAGW